MNMSHLILGTAALLALPTVALVAMPASQQPATSRADVEAHVKERFTKADANSDGVVEKAEALAAREKSMAERQDAHFKAMDKNGDGSISRAEFDAAHAMPGHDDGAGMQGKHQGRHHKRAGMAHDGQGRMGARAG